MIISPITLLERFGLGSLIVSAVEQLTVGVTDRLMRPASFAERSGITEADYARIRADVRRPGQGRVRAECFLAMRKNDLRGRLSQVEAPSLVLWGAEDNTVPLRDAGVVADEWPEADLRIIPKAGHWPHFEMPDIQPCWRKALANTPTETSAASPAGMSTPPVNWLDIPSHHHCASPKSKSGSCPTLERLLGPQQIAGGVEPLTSMQRSVIIA